MVWQTAQSQPSENGEIIIAIKHNAPPKRSVTHLQGDRLPPPPTLPSADI